MKKTWSLVCSAICSVMVTGAVVSSEAEVYRSRTMLDLEWGDGPGQIGYREHLAGYESASAGPTSFDIDGDGNVYILDTVNSRVKAFDEHGKLLRGFDIEGTGREYGYIALDEARNVWIHDPWVGAFRAYTPEGVLTRSIFYPDKLQLGFEFQVREGVVHSLVGVVEIVRLSSEPGVRGEKVYDARVDREKGDGRYIENLGRVSGRLYKSVEPGVSEDGKPRPPRIDVVHEDGHHEELIFSDVDPLYMPYFLAEDALGNVYFTLYYIEAKRPQQIHKYSPDLVFLAKIEGIEYNRGFWVTKDKVVDSEGRIYNMRLDRAGVKIVVWESIK